MAVYQYVNFLLWHETMELHPVNNYYANTNICDISKSIQTMTIDYNNIEFIEFLEFSAILELIDSIILILLSIFPFTLKSYENA